MQETKAPRDPKKSLWASYLIIFLLVIGFNALFMPMLARAGVRQVDYGTFFADARGRPADHRGAQRRRDHL